MSDWKKAGTIVPYVFQRDGREFRKAWETAATKAGVPGRPLHDFRRTAVRNLAETAMLKEHDDSIC